MKILFVAMPSVHFIRWIENLKDTKHELFWFDILDRKELKTSLKIKKITGWKKRKLSKFKGEYFLYKNFPKFYRKINSYLEVTVEEAFNNVIKELQPDLVHSFEMQNCSYPIFEIMQNNNIKWLYSCWGSDLFYYQNFNYHLKKIKQILHRLNFIHTDNKRDIKITSILGFNGDFTEIIPGGTGYKLDDLEQYKTPLKDRKIILIKGYEHTFGRAINVLRAISKIKDIEEKYQIEVFGCHKKTIDFIKDNKLKYKYYTRNQLTHLELLKLFGKAKIYIGNSISDGLPNTLLESIIMEAFPIQSNPGNVTQEIIDNGYNGFLIKEPDNVTHIKSVIENVLNLDKKDTFTKAINYNKSIAVNKLDFFLNKEKVTKLKGLEGIRIVHLAGFRPQKDHETLILAFKDFTVNNPEWTLHLIGKIYEDKYSENILSLIRKHNLEKLIYTYNSCLDIEYILNQATIGVLSSKSEGLPVSLLEYGLAKLPVITTNVGECSKVVENNFSGFVIKPNNSISLSQALTKLAQSSKLRKDFSKRYSKKVIANYSRESFIENLLNIYSD